jgi:hypothetical protein
MPISKEEDMKMEFHSENDSRSELEALVEKSAYELLRDVHVAELSERLKPVEEVRNEL